MKKSIFLQRTLGALIAYFAALAFISAGFKWYWLFICFLLFDISMIGYIRNPRIGALLYNFGHGFITPVLLMLAGYAVDSKLLLFVSLSWIFHIAIDRTFGYGLKKPDSFKHTDLGNL